jgi:hypothetical protein
VGNADAYEAFMKSESAHLINEEDDHLRARVHKLNARALPTLYSHLLSWRYAEGTLKKRLENTRNCLWRDGFFGVMDIVLGTEQFFGALHYVDVWCMVFAAGATGGLLSLQRRLQSLPSYGESLSDFSGAFRQDDRTIHADYRRCICHSIIPRLCLWVGEWRVISYPAT